MRPTARNRYREYPPGYAFVVPTERSRSRPCRTIRACIGIALLLTASVRGQDVDQLRERCLLALHGQQAPPSRQYVLTPRPAPQARGVIAHFPRKPGAIPVHTCPLCAQNMVQVDLWRGPAGIDSQDVFTAHVCEKHALFFVTNDGVMHASEAGPFALPANAQDKPVRPFLPYGAVVADDKEVWPASKWASADGRLYQADGDAGVFLVRNTDRVLYREPAADNNGMGLMAWDISGEAGLCALARSMGPLVVAELGTGKRRARVPVRADNITAVAIHPDGTYVAFVVLEGGHQRSSFRVLEFASGQVKEFAREPDRVPGTFLFLPGSRLVTTTHDGAVSAWSLASGKREWERAVDPGTVQVRTLSRSPDGRRVLVVTRSGLLASLLDAATGAVDSQLVARQPFADERGGGPVPVAWSPDSLEFAWSYDAGRLARSDLATPGEVHRHFGAAELQPTDGSTLQLRFTADGNAVQTRDRDGHQLRWLLPSFDAPR